MFTKFKKATSVRCFTSQASLNASAYKYFQPDRDNHQKYTLLQGAKSFNEAFEDIPDLIHPNLKTSLMQNNLQYLTPIQQQVIDNGIMHGQSMLIHSEPGSGKTLSYLLPVLNQLHFYKDE